MNNGQTSVLDDPIGQALADAIDARVRGELARPTTARLSIVAVHRGARRRRAVRRAALAGACAALVGLTGIGLMLRSTDPVPLEPADRPWDTTSTLPVYAVLDPSIATPVAMGGQAGGTPRNVPLPAVDVWTRGSETIVVRTYRADPNGGAADSPDVTSAPPTASGRGAASPLSGPVEPITVLGVDGQLEQLDDLQWAAWVPGREADGTLIIGRGIDRQQMMDLLADVDVVDGVIEPDADGFVRIERAPSIPSTAPALPFVVVTYDFADGPRLSTFLPPSRRESLESSSGLAIGRTTNVAGREVLVWDEGGATTVQWLDPSGVVITLTATGTADQVLDMVSKVRLVEEQSLESLSKQVSVNLMAELREIDSAVVGDHEVTRRADAQETALCMNDRDATPVCASVPSGVLADGLDMTALIDGHWYIVGWRTSSGYAPNFDDLRFTADDGREAAISWIANGDEYWYIAQVPDGVNAVQTNIGNVVSGPVGRLTRPTITSTI